MIEQYRVQVVRSRGGATMDVYRKTPAGEEYVGTYMTDGTPVLDGMKEMLFA